MQKLIRRLTSIAGFTLSLSEARRIVKDLVLKGQYAQTLELYKEQLHPPSHIFHGGFNILPSVIKACSYAQNRYFGLQLHCTVLKTGYAFDHTISNSLISMYDKFSDVECAHKVFDVMPQKDSVSWNSMVNCYAQHGYFEKSLKLFQEMYLGGFVPKPELVASVLSICGRNKELRLGREIHAILIVDGRIEDSVFLWTAVVGLYVKCNDSLMAFRVFDRMEDKNEVSWTSMVSGFVANHDYNTALDCFRAMQLEGIKPNRVTVIIILPVCAELGSVKHGREVHGYALRHGFNLEFRFSSALMHMYCKCGSIQPAKLIFERSTVKDVVMWTSIIGSYSQNRDTAESAIEHFCQMQKEGVQPNSVTLLAVISACTNISSVNHGRAFHGYVLKSGLNYEAFIGNSLINMYSKCGYLMDACHIFKEMPVRDSVSWSTLISAHGFHGCGEEALRLFFEMQEQGMEVDEITFLAVLSACNHSGLVEEGQEVFSETLKNDKLMLTAEHYACYIDLLGRAGKLEDAYEIVTTMSVKRSTKIWSSLISACKIHGRLEVAEMLARWLIKSEPENPANYTLLGMVCAESGNWNGVEETRRDMRLSGLKKSCGFSKI